MCRDHVVDCVARETVRFERRKQTRHRIVRSGVDERRAPVLDDQEARIEAGTHERGVDHRDAVVQALEEVVHARMIRATIARR